MDEYQHMEKFGLENDFEDGQWIGGEFYYRKRKGKRSQTKEDVLYGVFANSDSDAEDSSRKRKKADFTKPVNFVSTGTVMPNQEIDKNNALEEKESQEKPGLGGLGFGVSGQGLGFGKDSSVQREAGEDNNSNEDDGDFLPTAFGRRIKEGAQRREKEKEKEKLRTDKKVLGKRDPKLGEVGEFERHTKGIGLKLLERMGYKGGGLGKNEQGIVAPIEAKLRPKNMGMGFNDFKENKLPVVEEPEEKKPAQLVGRSKEKLWLKQSRGKKKDINIEELLAKKEEESVSLIEKVYDMRGPQVRVLTNLENLNAEEEAKENQVPMPELQHNVKLIVDLAEHDVQTFNRKLRLERENVASLQLEKEKLEEKEIEQRRQLSSMERIMGMLDRLKEDSISGTLTLDSLAKTFKDLQRAYGSDYKHYNLSCIACAFAFPLLIRVFQGWDPLKNPSHGLELMNSWKDLLQGDDPYDYSDVNVSPPYTQLVMEVIFPAVRISGTHTWKARDPEPMLRYLELWDKLLPPPVLQSILQMVVMPKLSEAVEAWDPRTETVPIHVWVHPWLPLLGQNLEVLYLTIRVKLGNVLHVWHASDSSAFAILSPWRTVFDPASWEQLIVRYIVPKLMHVLQEFQVNPANQKLDQFYWVMSWASAIPIQHMVTMLETGFFSKWHQVLYHWLCSNPNYEEVTQWFLGWKGLFPSELLANERIRSLLNVGLEMMNQAVEGMEVVQPGARENVNYLRVTEQRQFEANQAQAAGYAPRTSGVHVDGAGGVAATEMSLKETIAAFAETHGLEFRPKPGSFYDGLQVYNFGSVKVCIDNFKQQIFAVTKEGLRGVTLEWLMDMQRSSGLGHL
ncbi:septin and tuftelin-interacting protein 1 homolog 1 [Aristolochia californica]|uniref:septin and tuftelin-interacting protein 1 homolog 1 n=1 Tax=Aristolochia californica TaxID=171875 RepID=UPI0035DCA2F8